MRHAMALVLSGGSGDRLSVLSAERAVSAIPFGGKYRIVDFVLSNCCHSEIERVSVLTQHAPTSLHDHLGSGRLWDLDRRGGGVEILQPFLTREHAGWYRGTADALAQNTDAIMASHAAQVLVLSGDHVYKMDYRDLFRAHEARAAAVTLAVTAVPPGERQRFGMVTVDRAGRVRQLEEKPKTTSARLASMGIYLFESEVLAECLRGHPVDLVLDVLRPLVEEGERVFAHEFEGYWDDVGTLESYYRANLDLVAPEPRLHLHDARWPILTRDEERPPVLMLTGAEVEDSLVANGCRVAGRVCRSILFPGVEVEAEATVVDSVVMQDTRILRGARVERAILDKFVRVGREAVVGSGADPRGDGVVASLTLAGKYAFVPERARVGRGAVLGVGTGPEDFVENQIRAGARVADHPAHADLR
ncbi:MAG: glucose-1-phosphate adenylyltransferase [Candidatus Eisenbacteria bacterium]|uniref:Glucose-1-phosphate adenylyltransferase n=1 Tax=Eiseniibacteriota bacterium TaxID=2212470 RepID=A0A538TL91_UNCEI|nr:MAG: glucose-1-phosphate adenylyltransferase [Candidatus Eisenbacteria bacterium]